VDNLKPTELFELYWRFADLRQNIYLRQLAQLPPPHTSDKILREYKFTNAYRAADRVSQYLINHVIYGLCNESPIENKIFNVLLFKLFNRTNTWERIVQEIGFPNYRNGPDPIVNGLRAIISNGDRIYSAAYIMPPPKSWHDKPKFERHIRVLFKEVSSGLLNQLAECRSIKSTYNRLLEIESIGKFLAYQYAIDIAYCPDFQAEESQFVVAGPGALRGIAKCFKGTKGHTPEEIILFTYENQRKFFKKYGINFPYLGGRELQPVDCQNLFCELDKYTRVSHPQFSEASGRIRIKQKYFPNMEPVTGWFPPKWGINEALSRQLNEIKYERIHYDR